LREKINQIRDPAQKQDELAERAEAIARSQEHPDIVRANVERYRHMLAAGIKDENQRRTVEQMLQRYCLNGSAAAEINCRVLLGLVCEQPFGRPRKVNRSIVSAVPTGG
jgi:hypothetical protein